MNMNWGKHWFWLLVLLLVQLPGIEAERLKKVFSMVSSWVSS